jgi:radical SAM superfamily enzyme YgiQ (UPF0313 family)
VITEYKPDAVGITSMTYELHSAFEDCSSIKAVFPNMPIVLGGSHISGLPNKTMEAAPSLDFGVFGEGESTATELFSAIRSGSDISSVKGIAFRSGDKITVNETRELIQNLDSLPFPDYDKLDLTRYRYLQKGWRKRGFMSMVTSRGCPFKCTFCAHAVFGRQVRMHSAEYIVNHMQFLNKKYHISGFGIMDDTFTINKNRVMEVCEQIKSREMDIIWFCFSSVKTIDSEMLTAMKQAGCVKISYGVESGDPVIQKNLEKNLNLDTVKEVFTLTKKAGIESLAFFMLGSKGETRETITRSKAFARTLDADFINVAVLCPLPGSDIYDEYKDTLPQDWSRFQITPYKKLPVLQLGDLSTKDLHDEMLAFNRSFYLRPSYLLSRARKIRSLDDALFYTGKALSVVREWF